jgi:hypothetical protein
MASPFTSEKPKVVFKESQRIPIQLQSDGSQLNQNTQVQNIMSRQLIELTNTCNMMQKNILILQDSVNKLSETLSELTVEDAE